MVTPHGVVIEHCNRESHDVMITPHGVVIEHCNRESHDVMVAPHGVVVEHETERVMMLRSPHMA